MAEVELPDREELAELSKDRFSKRVALLTAFFAVLLAITSLGGNNAAKEMMLAAQQASNQWAFYQSKAMRENLYRLQRLQLEAGVLERQGQMAAAARARYDELLKQLSTEEIRYRTEKKEIEQEAKRQEEVRNRNMAKDPYFDYAEVLLQIAIVMASIAILANSRPVLGLAILAALGGTVLMVNGYLLLFRIPFFH
jgi:hypothetical protein